jgi:hypothetical protein
MMQVILKILELRNKQRKKRTMSKESRLGLHKEMQWRLTANGRNLPFGRSIVVEVTEDEMITEWETM